MVLVTVFSAAIALFLSIYVTRFVVGVVFFSSHFLLLILSSGFHFNSLSFQAIFVSCYYSIFFSSNLINKIDFFLYRPNSSEMKQNNNNTVLIFDRRCHI